MEALSSRYEHPIFFCGKTSQGGEKVKIPFCSAQQSKRFVHYLESRYGIPPVVMKEWRWIQHKESVFVVTQNAAEWSHSQVNVFALGLQAFTHAKTFEPTSNFITLIGKRWLGYCPSTW